MCIQVILEAREGTIYPGTGVTGCIKPLGVCAEKEDQVLCKKDIC